MEIIEVVRALFRIAKKVIEDKDYSTIFEDFCKGDDFAGIYTIGFLTGLKHGYRRTPVAISILHNFNLLVKKLKEEKDEERILKELIEVSKDYTLKEA